MCFISVVALWLASSGRHALAEADKFPLITESLSRTVSAPAEFNRTIHSPLELSKTDGLVQRLSVHLDLAAADPRSVKVYLTSPAGTRVLLASGASSRAARRGGLEGWFGHDGLDTPESMVAFAGEPIAGQWILSVDARGPGQLRSWTLTADVGPNSNLAGWETASAYVGMVSVDPAGQDCACRVVTQRRIARSLLDSTLLLLGLLLIRRRRR